MNKNTRTRDVVGTLLTFLFLAVVVVGLIYGENLLEAFKAH